MRLPRIRRQVKNGPGARTPGPDRGYGPSVMMTLLMMSPTAMDVATSMPPVTVPNSE